MAEQVEVNFLEATEQIYLRFTEYIPKDTQISIRYVASPAMQTVYTFVYYGLVSSKAIGCQWVCVCVCLFPNSYKTVNPNEQKFWGMIPLGVQMVLG